MDGHCFYAHFGGRFPDAPDWEVMQTTSCST